VKISFTAAGSATYTMCPKNGKRIENTSPLRRHSCWRKWSGQKAKRAAWTRAGRRE
jgi:hypothetical protein